VFILAAGAPVRVAIGPNVTTFWPVGSTRDETKGTRLVCIGPNVTTFWAVGSTVGTDSASVDGAEDGSRLK